MTELEAMGAGTPPPYIMFLVVFLFFLTGLLGFLICHLLKKKGYHCRTDVGDEEEEEEEKLGENADDEDEENQDTVEQILKCIIQNEANMEAFNEMLGNHKVCVRHDPRLRKESIGGIPPHLHTVHSGIDHNSCHLCAQIKSKKGRRQSRTLRAKQRPGEQTVFSVGRFRVTHTDKKSHGGPSPLAISGDQLDQSQDSDDRKDGGYNLRSMFKEVRRPSESASGVSANVGRRKKSVTIFGLRRGSDPVGMKVGEETGKDIGGVKFAVQQQPVVLEEPMPVKNIKVDLQRGTKSDSILETELQQENKTSSSLNSPSSQIKTVLNPEPCKKIQSSSGSTVASAPSSLPIPSEKGVNVEGQWIKPEEAYEFGPLQTSTPIVPMPTSIPGFTSVTHTGQLGACSRTGSQLIQDLSSGSDMEPGLTLDSSPSSSFPIKTPSSVSSLKTPTSPLAGAASPKVGSKNMPPEAVKGELPRVLTPSPKLPLHQEMSSQSPVSYSSFRQTYSPSQARAPERELEGTTMPKAEEKLEFKRPGILKKNKLSPVAAGESKSSALSSSPEQLFKDRSSSLPLSPSSLSPSSPQGGRISSVTIVKASPDSQREFSVVTMVEEEKSTTNDQKEDDYELGAETDKRVIRSAEGDDFEPGAIQPESQSGKTSGVEVIPSLSQEKEDMMEMEDIRDCKVMQVEGAQLMEEEVELKMEKD
ncbi:RELT-like protein 2 isoform X1 [Simochromis diagramma]|uniref:RELT-like protein 2 isoform X1 n=1 Tax=Simochromis diagramma TaxID=43689 RepID=UPI001A7E60D6|nr:RELT-like protein 2 isoform X1 [Simochromis diagramma]XP_039866133.1 RELT-like protein 2 isoform X1 [Simochromis diagramma]XP_039866134.1 RELT-like protein 2 isoform X1 [Simochromis diagramma]XP_039866135.1 RELT-like protein 2 isoform X1 [Simochromis diagramma]